MLNITIESTEERKKPERMYLTKNGDRIQINLGEPYQASCLLEITPEGKLIRMSHFSNKIAENAGIQLDSCSKIKLD